jgi:hypothetical protein
MNMIEKMNKPISKFLATFVLFLFVTVLLGNPIQDSIENILLSRAKVHSQTYNLALSPLPEQRAEDNIDRYSLINTSSAGLRDRSIVTSDARATALRQFLMDYNSPMAPYADVFVKTADEYGLDWRLAAAISGVESAFGVIPVRANNAWGWKGGADGDFNAFDTWGHGIEVVTTRLALGYGTHMTPFEIEPIYCPPCGQNPAHLWANGVIKFMNQIDMYLHGF